ncbi:MAG TPA: toll/interleukin-1 receptor domain-containing protein [Thermoanaerobaculia bacterium]|nr:toll/interleukin-1 receptor domain-containing protein [Thermoanaerobaculia bacterium]
MRRFWATRTPSALAIVGIGGMGKTALLARFVEELQRGEEPPDALLAWSSDEEPDVDRFVHEAATAMGVSRGDLVATLARRGHSLIVLDGAAGTSKAFAKLLADIADTKGAVQALVTTRRSATALWTQKLVLTGLSHEASVALLDRAGVPASQRPAAVQYGGHPLSLQLLTAYAAHGGTIPVPLQLPVDRPPAMSLTFVLERLNAELTSDERELLRRIALLRNGARMIDFVATYPPGAAFDVATAFDRLVSYGLARRSPDGVVSVHPLVRSYALQTWGGDVDPSFVLDLLGRGEPRLPEEKAELITEMLHNISDRRSLSRSQIARLAAQLPPDDSRSARAYSVLLQSALKLMPGDVKRRAFISYLHEDAEVVARLRRDLEQEGIDVWQDIDRTGAGKRWKDEIRNAIREGDAFIACFSPAYAARQRTHMNEELLIAIEELRQRKRSVAWFISVIVGVCEIPEHSIGVGETLRDLQWVDLHADWAGGVQRVARAILEPC